MIDEIRIDAAGELARYRADRAACRAALERAAGPVLLVGHGDADGIVSTGLVLRFLEDRGVRCAVESTAEFRAADLDRIAPAAAAAATVVLLECQGSDPAWAALDPKTILIDHHPPDAHIRSRVLNPRLAGLDPNPACGHVVWDLLADALPPCARWLAAAAAAIDRCGAAAASIRAAESARLARLAEVEEAFLSVQYRGGLCAEAARVVARIPEPDALLCTAPFALERARFRAALAAGLAAAERAAAAPGLLVVRVAAGDGPRVASPLATRLGEAHPDRLVAVCEEDAAAGRARVSFRAASGRLALGPLLAAAVRDLSGADASGHERSASARVPLASLDVFLDRVETEVGRRSLHTDAAGVGKRVP